MWAKSLLPVVLYGVVLGFDHSDAVQLRTELGDGLGELLPDFNRKVLGRRKNSEHKRRVVIQVLMVEGLDHVLDHEGL